MKKNLLSQTLFSLLLFVFVCQANSVFAVARTWVGAGAGGAGTDFNNVANWTGGGALAAGDDFTMNLTTNTTQTISLSANITVNNLTVTQNSGSGARTTTFSVGAFTLTVNGSATFNSVRYSNPLSYDVLNINVNSGGNIIFNGVTRIHTNGNGDTYVITENAGSTVTTGTVTFNNNVYIGTWASTSPGYEPNVVFNAVGSQTFVSREAGGGYQFKAQNLTFGTTNTPSVTLRGPGAVYFDSYDGNMTVAANTNVIVPDTTVVGYMCVLDRYITAAGTLTMGAGSMITTGCPNVTPMTGFGTYALNATSTVWYNSAGYQMMMPITYGHVIADGVGSPAWKYSNGAQTMQGNFTIQNTGIYGPNTAGGLTINGTTLIQSSGTFNATRDNARPNTTHTLKGNFTNNATFTNGSPVGINTMLFNSSTAGQTIGGTSLTTFYHLTIDNTSGSGVTLGRNENVSESAGTGVLTLTNGPLYLNNFTLTIQNTATTAITRTSGYIVSESTTNASQVLWQMASTTGAHVFPFGTSAGVYIPFTFNPTAGTSSNVTLSTYKTSQANAPLPSSPTVVTNLNSTTGLTCSFGGANNNCDATADRFWQITVSGTPTATLTFSYDPAAGPGGEMPASPYNIAANMRAQRYDAATNSWVAALGGQSTTANSVTVPGVTTFSPWALASSSSPLPIELLNFNASLNGDKVELAWATATEVNNDFFTIEKSRDGKNFEELMKTDGAGNSTRIIDYFETDYQPYKGVSYYRLKQTDYNGKFTYSNTVPVEYNPGGDGSVFLFPNPANEGSSTYLSLNELKGQSVLVVLRDIVGRELFSKVVIIDNEKEIIALDEEGKLAKGSYLVTAAGSNSLYCKKLIVR